MSRAHHEHLVEDAKAAIGEVHGDTSVSQEETIESLREIAGEIEVMIEAVEKDIERNEREASEQGDAEIIE